MDLEKWEMRHKILSSLVYGFGFFIEFLLALILMMVIAGCYRMILDHEDILLAIAERMGI